MHALLIGSQAPSSAVSFKDWSHGPESASYWLRTDLMVPDPKQDFLYLLVSVDENFSSLLVH